MSGLRIWQPEWKTMSMGIEVGVFLAYAFGMLMIYVFGRFFLVPLKWIGLGIASSIIGGIVIMIMNSIGAAFGIFVPLNVVTAVITGVLGVPGLLMLILFFA